MNKDMQKITPFLWFDTQAKEAAKFYTSLKSETFPTMTDQEQKPPECQKVVY